MLVIKTEEDRERCTSCYKKLTVAKTRSKDNVVDI